MRLSFAPSTVSCNQVSSTVAMSWESAANRFAPDDGSIYRGHRPPGRKEAKILSFPTITGVQIAGSLLAIPAFVPAMVCTGYSAAWFTNLHNFRERSLVERIFWSVPLSLAVTTIASVLIGRFLTLDAVVAFLMASTAICIALICWEGAQLRRFKRNWNIGWRPLGGKALIVAVIWIIVAVLSLVDLQADHKLFMTVTVLDMDARVSWTESILRTGIPPTNPLYQFKQPTPMRNYYFWYVDCAAIARMARLPVRAVLVASGVWAGFLLAALTGIYLKYFLVSGVRLRVRFLRATLLLMVTGLDLCVALWDIFFLHHLPPAELDLWSKDAIFSWLSTFLWAPHHIASLVCCMLAFLLAWLAGKETVRSRAASIVLIAAALASAFGLSVFVTFAFFLVMVVWAFWQLVIERTSRAALFLAAGGAGATVLLIPYLWELSHTSSGTHGPRIFGFGIREMIPPDGLMASSIFQHFAASHPFAALNIARLVFLIPGYVVELGFFFIVLLIYLVPAWRGRTPLTPEQRSLVFIVIATLAFVSLIRSGVLQSNDFGWRGSLILQFPLLLLASEIVTDWNHSETRKSPPGDGIELHQNMPQWLRSIAALTLVIGALGIVYQGLMLRFITLLGEGRMSADYDPKVRSFSHNAYISLIGYDQLDAVIPHDAVVQFNPIHQEPFWIAADLLGVDHQTAIMSDQPWCGSELGGDSSGCTEMSGPIDAIFNGETAEKARNTCNRYGIQFLVARIYDPSWKDKSSWVWTLPTVVSDNEFRALDCR